MTIDDRLDAALSKLNSHWKGNRRPKAFYLVQADWVEFTSTERPTVRTMFGNNPPLERVELSFREVPVRQSDGLASRLYDNTTTWSRA